MANYLSDPAALPYFLCVDDSTDASPPLSTWNKFEMESSTTFKAGFVVTGSLTFDTYLTMGYGHSAVKAQRLLPKYYNPEFNRKAAWKVNVNPPTGTTVGTTWDDNDSFPQNVVVEVYDWQIGATVSTEPDFGDADPSNVFSVSEPSEVTVEVLGMSTVLPTANTADDPLASGMPDDPWIYTIAVPNDNLPAGNYPGLVCVTDTRVPLGIPPVDQRDYLIDSPDGILLNFYNIDKFATYQTFDALVVVGCGPITGQIDIPATCPVTGVANGASLNFVASAVSSNGGTVQEYQADLDYDGVTFDVDAVDPDGDFGSLGPFINPNCGTPPEDPVTFTVAIRAYDDCVPPNYEILGTCDITVEFCNLLPIGDVTMEVNRIPASGSGHGWQFDPDGPWTLNWTANASAAEYAVYYDNDAGDYTSPTWDESELTDNLVYVGVSTTTSYTVPTTHLPSTHYSSGMTYVVRGRTVAGDSGSEYGDSEPAFIMINGWETISQQYSIMGVAPAASEGWHATKQSSNAWDQSTTTAVRAVSNVYHSSSTNSWVAHGQCYGRQSRNTGQSDAGLLYLPGNYEGFTTRVPTVPNTSTRFLEFSCYVRGSTNYIYDGGLIIGSYSGTTQPDTGWTDPENFNWAEPESTYPYHGYDGYSPEVENWFGMPSPVPNPNAFVGIASADFYTYLFGCDVGTSATPDPFIGVMDCSEIFPAANAPTYSYWLQLDEVAIMIY